MQLPPNIADRLRYPSAIVDRVRDLAHSLLDAQIADEFNRKSNVSATGKPYTAKMIQWIRKSHRIPSAVLKKPEELTIQQIAEQFGISDNVVYYWIERGLIHARGSTPECLTGLRLTKQSNKSCETGCATQPESRIAKP